MVALVIVLGSLVGLGLTGLGVRTWWRGRFRSPDARRRRRGRRLVALGGLVGGLTPVAATIVAAPTGGDLLAALIACIAVGGAITLVTGGLLLASVLAGERVGRATRGATERVVARVPAPRVLTGRSAATSGLPREWSALVDLDRSLGRRLLRYGSVDDAAAHPVMNDLDDPRTRAAIEAMLRCDELRTSTPPQAWRDVRGTAYAEAVAAFRDALAEAEAHSHRVNRGSVADAERVLIERAVRELGYLREHATTPGERHEVYRRLTAELAAVGEPEPAPARSHPWLDVPERSRAR